MLQRVEHLLAQVAARLRRDARQVVLLLEGAGELVAGNAGFVAVRAVLHNGRRRRAFAVVVLVLLAAPVGSLALEGEAVRPALAEGEDRHRLVLVDPLLEVLPRGPPDDGDLLADEPVALPVLAVQGLDRLPGGVRRLRPAERLEAGQ